GEDDHPRAGVTIERGFAARVGFGRPENPPGGGQPVHPGHLDVHEYHVGPQVCGEGHGGSAVTRLADHLDVRLRPENDPEPGPDQVLVVGEEDPDRPAGGPGRVGPDLRAHHDTAASAAAEAASASGNRARTWNPPPPRGPPRIPTRPSPPPSGFAGPGVGPRPSSLTSTSRAASRNRTRTSTCWAWACRTVLVNASWTTRYAERATAVGTGRAGPCTE